MPKYRAIQSEVRITSGFVPKTCWIAHVLELLGKKMRLPSYRVDPNVRRHPCPAERQAAMMEAIRKLEKLGPRPCRSSL
jgi:hypothetical protein